MFLCSGLLLFVVSNGGGCLVLDNWWFDLEYCCFVVVFSLLGCGTYDLVAQDCLLVFML